MLNSMGRTTRCCGAFAIMRCSATEYAALSRSRAGPEYHS